MTQNERGGERITTGFLLQQQLQLVLAGLMPDNRLVALVMLHTGLRVGDVLQLRADQIGRSFWVTEAKTGKRRHVGLPDGLTAEIRRRAGPSVWAFPSPRDPAKHRTRQAVWKDIDRTAKALRLPVNAGTHSMRKAFAVDLMRKYGDLEIVRKALNHDNPTVTLLYAMADHLTASAGQRSRLHRRKR